MTYIIDGYGDLRITSATAPALMAVAGLQPDRLASPLPPPANRFTIDRNSCVFVVPLGGIALLRRALEDGMRLARVDAVVVRWTKSVRGRDLVSDVAIRDCQTVTWHNTFRPWLDAGDGTLWLVPEASDGAVWFKLSERGITVSAIPPFDSQNGPDAGLDRAKEAILHAIVKVLDADPLGRPGAGGPF